jgi:two-component system, cell cycle sensor histidine kinase and response regulator CckA
MSEPLRILHLEDEPHDQELVRATIESEDFACEIEVVDSRATFEAALERGGFDLVVSDFALPSFDGLSALRLLRARDQDTPLIFVSGTLGEEAAIEAVRSGATDYVLKQRLARLVPAIRRAMSEAVALRKRREIEDTLKREREFSTQLIESSVDGILAFDPGFTIASWNAGMERMTGVARDAALGRSAREFFPEFESIGARGTTHRPVVHRDMPFMIPTSGKKGFFDAHLSPLKDESGAVAGWLAILHDTTRRRGLEEQFRQAQKMEAIGRLAGGVAHDFNNLLTAILGYGELLRRRLKGQTEALDDLAEIEKASNRASSLTRQLLALSRQQVLNPRVLDLNGVVLDLDKMLRRLIGEDIDLRTVPSAELGHIKADPGQVEQVLMNLVVNARDAMHDGGKLTIETANVTLYADSVGASPEQPPGSYVMLAVSDTGVGMTAETQARVFEPFFTTKEMGKGTGLGLSTVHGIVLQSGGHVEVYSEVGHGTIFKVYFPRVDEALDPGQSEASALTTCGGAERLLVIEDDDLVRGITVRALRGAGYDVVEAGNRDDAWEFCVSSGPPFDLVISDVVMPGMTLADMANRLGERFPDLPVLYMSGYTDRAILHQEQFAAVEAFLQKPFRLEMLLERVRALLDRGRRAAA